MNASGLLNFRQCCALMRLEGISQVEMIPTCVSLLKGV
jgi:hypothetical protein